MNNTIRGAMDRRLSGLDIDERMLRRLSLRVEELEGRSGPGRYRGPVVLIAVLVLVVLAAGALAAAVFSGAVDWFGHPIRTETVEPTPVPSSAEAAAMIQTRVDEMALEKPDDEIWVVSYSDGSGNMHLATEQIASFEEVKQRLLEAGSPLKTPEIPQGYHFVRGQFLFYYTQETLGNFELIGTEMPFQGVTLKKYRPGEDSKGCILSCSLMLEDQKGRRLEIDASLDFLTTEWEFGVSEGETYETIPVQGMKNALYIGEDGNHMLYLLKAGISPVKFIDLSVLDPRDDVHFEPECYDAIVYRIHSEDLGKEDLIAIAESLN